MISDSDFRTKGVGLKLRDSGFRVQGVTLRVEGLGLKVEGRGFIKAPGSSSGAASPPPAPAQRSGSTTPALPPPCGALPGCGAPAPPLPPPSSGTPPAPGKPFGNISLAPSCGSSVREEGKRVLAAEFYAVARVRLEVCVTTREEGGVHHLLLNEVLVRGWVAGRHLVELRGAEGEFQACTCWLPELRREPCTNAVNGLRQPR